MTIGYSDHGNSKQTSIKSPLIGGHSNKNSSIKAVGVKFEFTILLGPIIVLWKFPSKDLKSFFTYFYCHD